MNLFVAAAGADGELDVSRIVAALSTASESFPALKQEVVAVSTSRSGRTAVASVSHPTLLATPRRYRVEAEDEVLVWDGLPLACDGTHLGDARALATRLRRSPSGIEGMFVFVRANLERDVVDVFTDPLGNLAVYEMTATDGTTYVSNSLAAMVALKHDREVDLVAASTFLTLGWYGGGGSALAGVPLVGGGTHLVLRPGQAPGRSTYFGPAVVAGQGGAPPLAAVRDALIGQLRSAATYGVPLRLGLTAGHDSRACLALAIAADVDVELYTEGAIGDEDVDVARAVARRAGMEHEIVPRAWHPSGEPDDLIAAFVRMGDATSTFAQVHDHLGQADGAAEPLAIKLLGLGGETARASTHPIRGYLVAGVPFASIRRIQFDLFARKLALADGLVRPLAREIALDTVARWFDDRAAEGWGTRSLAETLYVFDAMIRQHQGAQRRTAATADLAAPLSSSPFVSYSLGLSPSRRYVRGVHRDLIEMTAPSLLEVPADPPLDRQRAALAPVLAASDLVRLARAGRGKGPVTTRTATDAVWSEQSASHVALVESARQSSLDRLIDRDVLLDVLRGHRPMSPGALRSLTLLWWFEEVAGAARIDAR